MAEYLGSVYFLVERTINSTKVCTVEYMSDPWEISNIHPTNTNAYVPEPLYLDYAWACVGTNPDGDGKSTIFSADPSAGAFWSNTTVSVLADGAYIGEVTIGTDAASTFTLMNRYKSVVIGFNYPGVLITNNIEVGGQVGTPIGRIKRIDEVVIRFVNSANAQFGKDINNLETIPFRAPSEAMDAPPTYYTGDKVVNFPAGYERNAKIIIKQDKPYPLYVTCIAPRGVTYD
jgi:hypothetical protein